MPHIVLLGDSIFDNAAYVDGGPDVVRQLNEVLPSGWKATLLAVDGACVVDVSAQLARLPRDATHLVLSVGGNDALSHLPILEERATSVSTALDRLAAMADRFDAAYASLLDRLADAGLPLVACTIYNGWLGEEPLQTRARTALMLFNDVIHRNAGARGLGTIELRAICTEPEHYANPIEPSVAGGERIAAAISSAVVGSG